MVAITHNFASAKSDGPDPTQVQPSHWNASHKIMMTGPGFVGATGAGNATEITISANFQLTGGVLNISTALAATIAAAVQRSGDTMTGPLALPGNPSSSLQAAPKQYVDAIVPPGSILMGGYAAAPAGFLECAGAAVSRATYAALFTAIGTAFGVGDGATTFNLPDMRGQFARGWDHGAGVDTGRALGSTQTDDLKSHTHTTSANTSGYQSGNPFTFVQLNVNYASGAFNNTTTSPTGGTETRPKNVALMFVIKT